MYDQAYDDYMRNVLGYNYMPDYRSPYAMMPQDLYGMNTYMPEETTRPQMINEELEECYPEIYKVVYPMVKRVCKNNTKPISKNVVDDIVSEIYYNIEPNESVNINVNVGNTSKINNVSAERDNRTSTIQNTPKPEIKTETRDVRYDSRKNETRNKNFLLNDLIKILVIRELLGRPEKPGNRPPQRPPVRPPFPGPGGRPPMRFNPEYDLYEF